MNNDDEGDKRGKTPMENIVQTPEESICQWIGPFAGYAMYEGRRSSDQVLREYVMERLAWFEKRVDELALWEQAPSRARAANSIRAQFQDSIELLQSVPYAFGEFMTAVSIARAELDALYQRDHEILLRLSAMQALVEPTLTESTDVNQLVKELGAAAAQLHQQIKMRQAAICEFVAPQPAFHGGSMHV